MVETDVKTILAPIVDEFKTFVTSIEQVKSYAEIPSLMDDLENLMELLAQVEIEFAPLELGGGD